MRFLELISIINLVFLVFIFIINSILKMYFVKIKSKTIDNKEIPLLTFEEKLNYFELG